MLRAFLGPVFFSVYAAVHWSKRKAKVTLLHTQDMLFIPTHLGWVGPWGSFFPGGWWCCLLGSFVAEDLKYFLLPSSLHGDFRVLAVLDCYTT